ncbi:hypothetical protein BESB_036080 [Besnoitia besnoiti]|uniref:Uncharacterized protein n=1 Tax=Besnoitia besnoiti TaxID=94643 RepID=A0A2A9MNA5_BESBE|nr:hypothetical protein BESB_036080 [Besnoitia besnoiti]PFH37150.1 hypothetical protein BESB_036080 [Besnoitia besnoiti]
MSRPGSRRRAFDPPTRARREYERHRLELAEFVLCQKQRPPPEPLIARLSQVQQLKDTEKEQERKETFKAQFRAGLVVKKRPRCADAHAAPLSPLLASASPPSAGTRSASASTVQASSASSPPSSLEPLSPLPARGESDLCAPLRSSRAHSRGPGGCEPDTKKNRLCLNQQERRGTRRAPDFRRSEGETDTRRPAIPHGQRARPSVAAASPSVLPQPGPVAALSAPLGSSASTSRSSLPSAASSLQTAFLSEILGAYPEDEAGPASTSSAAEAVSLGSTLEAKP